MTAQAANISTLHQSITTLSVLCCCVSLCSVSFLSGIFTLVLWFNCSMIYLRTSMWLTFFTQWHHCFYEKPSPLLLSSPVATKAFLVSSLSSVVCRKLHLISTTPFSRWACEKQRSPHPALHFSLLFLPVWHLSLCSFLPLLKRFSDIILATILATKSDICGKKFELKIDNVRFVGHPTLLQHPPVIQVGIIRAPPTSCWVSRR